MSPLVSALVLNYRSPQEAVKCVEALVSEATNPDSSLREILVIDNHSCDDSIGVLRNRLSKYSIVRIIETPRNLGFGAGYNAGFRHAKGTYVLVDNPMKKLVPGALAAMVAAMEEDPSIGIVGPQLIQDDGTVRDSARSFPSLLDVLIKRTFLERIFTGRMQRYRQLDRDPQTPRDTDWLVGGCLLIRRSLLEKIGGFDPRFFLFFEDIDLCRRAWKAGSRVRYLPEAQASDRKRRLSEGGILRLLLTRTGRAHVASGMRYFWKWRH